MVNKKIFVQQTNQSWCGLACLSMITKYYGGEISQEKLVNISGTNVSGTTLLGLYQAATVIGLQAEGMEGNIDDLAKLTHPTILHFTLANGLQHYVIYFGINNGKYIIADPAIGFEEIDVQALKEKWKSKTLLSVKKTDKFKETSAVNKEKQNWLKSLLKPDIQILSVVLVFSVVFSALGITLALFSQKLVDDILPSKEITRLITGIIIITLLLLVKNGIGYIRTKLSARQLRDFSNRIISQYYNIVLFLPKFFFDSLKTGEITARLNDAARIQHTISYAVGAFIIDIFTIIIVSVILFLYWWPIGIIVIIGSLFFTWIFLKNAKKILNAQKQVMTNYAQSESFFFDSVQGAGVIKAFGREQYFSQMGLNIYNLFQHAIFDLTLLNTRIGLWAQNIAVAVIVIVIAIGSNAVMNDVLSLGALMAVITFCSTLLTSVSSLMGAYFAYQEAKVAYNRLYEFAGMEKENHKEKITFTSVKELSLRNVSFRYTGRPLVFKNLSFTATIGAVNVIAGDVGCGKTTLLNLLIRFYKPETGEITVDSVNIEKTTLQQWRISTGIMYQSTKLFNATLVENICLSNEEQALRQAMTLCDNLKITTYFNALPLGFLTRIGEDGINLSGGQLQLVGLCRALYNNPAILLLDEPTNNMDEKTKALFWEIISVEKSKRICIVVSHEKEMISRADNIIAL